MQHQLILSVGHISHIIDQMGKRLEIMQICMFGQVKTQNGDYYAISDTDAILWGNSAMFCT